MEVEVIEMTRNPVDVISRAAGMCYGKRDYSDKRVRRCMELGHMSVLEHASVTFRIDGISRACSHQLVRHRMASYCQLSQRYKKPDFTTEWYVTPEGMTFAQRAAFSAAMSTSKRKYTGLIKKGMSPEDARYVLPEATKTSIVVTMNFRELLHFLSLRMDKAAQWEIRKMAEKMADVLSVRDKGAAKILEWAGYL